MRFILVAVKYKPMICTTILTTLPITDETKNIYINSYIRAPLTFESVNWSLILLNWWLLKEPFFWVAQSIHCRFLFFSFFFSFFVCFLDKTPFNFRAIYDFSVLSCYCDLCLGSPLR